MKSAYVGWMLVMKQTMFIRMTTAQVICAIRIQRLAPARLRLRPLRCPPPRHRSTMHALSRHARRRASRALPRII